MAGSRWFRRDALELDDDDGVGAFDSAEGDPAAWAVVGDNNVAQAQVDGGDGPNAKIHELPSIVSGGRCSRESMHERDG